MDAYIISLRQKGRIDKTVELIVHVCVWGYIFASPLLVHKRGESIDWIGYVQRLYFPFTSCVLFYVNYFYLVPRLVLERKRYWRFVLYNVLFILLLLLSQDIYASLLPPPEMPRRFSRRFLFSDWHGRSMIFRLAFMMRNFLSMGFMAFVALAIRLSMQWHKAEAARQEAELRRQEAELQNIKNQINPHFLLNTLNNIYALTAFDVEAAQRAIQELSRLLRYVLYENQSQYVSLHREADFIGSYVALMRIRLSANVKVEMNFDIPEGESCQVAPLIFISLVENAFKHGVSPTKPSFIRITLRADDEHIHFECANSNFPKNASDKSPGGIGLKQVAQRLRHTYAGHYIWQYGVDEKTGVYRSIIYISLKKLVNDGTVPS